MIHIRNRRFNSPEQVRQSNQVIVVSAIIVVAFTVIPMAIIATVFLSSPLSSESVRTVPYGVELTKSNGYVIYDSNLEAVPLDPVDSTSRPPQFVSADGRYELSGAYSKAGRRSSTKHVEPELIVDGLQVDLTCSTTALNGRFTKVLCVPNSEYQKLKEQAQE